MFQQKREQKKKKKKKMILATTQHFSTSNRVLFVPHEFREKGVRRQQ